MPLITETTALKDACRRLSRADYLTVDTEFMREGTFWPRLCLVQVAGPDDAFAIDPLADGIDLSPFFDLLAEPDILTVMHAAKQDMEIFFYRTGTLPTPLFDTQVAAMVCGFGDQVGYESLIAKLTGVRLDKSSRFTDWAHRPLSAEQLDYALGDVIHLRPAYEALRRHVEKAGRLDWIEEEIAALTDPQSYRLEPDEAWRRLKPRRSEARYLAVLQAVAAWREREAMQRDLPRNRILRDEILLQIAAHPPADARALDRVRALPQGFARGKLGAGLLAAVARGLATPPDQAPTLSLKPELPRGIGPLIDLLKVLLKHKCEQHDVAQKLVASVGDLEQIAADDKAAVAALKGWRREVFGADALRLKHGRIALAADGKHVRLVPVNGAGSVETPAGEAPPEGAGGRRRARRRRRRPAAGQSAVDSGLS